MNQFKVHSFPGLTTYQEVYDFQLKCLKERIENQITDTLIFAEHFPILTQGRGLQWIGTPRARHVPVPESNLPIIKIERGGDLTYHGPGQLVIYPIFKLVGRRDILQWIRFLESIIMDVLLDYGLNPVVKENATGVWIKDQNIINEKSGAEVEENTESDLNFTINKNSNQKEQKLENDIKFENSLKIASIGIALRHFVSYHGIGFNIFNDTACFDSFMPCGFSPKIMTSLKDHLEIKSWEDERIKIEEKIIQKFNLRYENSLLFKI